MALRDAGMSLLHAGTVVWHLEHTAFRRQHCSLTSTTPLFFCLTVHLSKLTCSGSCL